MGDTLSLEHAQLRTVQLDKQVVGAGCRSDRDVHLLERGQGTGRCLNVDLNHVSGNVAALPAR